MVSSPSSLIHRAENPVWIMFVERTQMYIVKIVGARELSLRLFQELPAHKVSCSSDTAEGISLVTRNMGDLRLGGKHLT